jgi:hypothetical protein
MAQGYVKYTNANVAARVDEVKVAYANLRRLMDTLIVIRNGTSYDLVAAATGAIGEDQGDVGLKIFDNLDAAMAGMTTACNALSNMDKNAL